MESIARRLRLSVVSVSAPPVRLSIFIFFGHNLAQVPLLRPLLGLSGAGITIISQCQLWLLRACPMVPELEGQADQGDT